MNMSLTKNTYLNPPRVWNLRTKKPPKTDIQKEGILVSHYQASIPGKLGPLRWKSSIPNQSCWQILREDGFFPTEKKKPTIQRDPDVTMRSSRFTCRPLLYSVEAWREWIGCIIAIIYKKNILEDFLGERSVSHGNGLLFNSCFNS